jgi:hypothetical protein
MRRRRHVLQVSTFPFLAVLLCTMGSLILILLVIDRRARVAALARAQLAIRQTEAEREKTAAEARAERERRWALLHAQLLEQDEQLGSQRMRANDQLQQAVAGLEQERVQTDELRQRLRMGEDHLGQLGLEVKTRQDEATRKETESGAAQAQLARLTSDVTALERLLGDLREARERQRKTYSLVPYRGKRGENRRPVYVECTADGLILHPDRLVLHAGSVRIPDVRAEIQRRLARQSAAEGKPNQSPYLLFLVRPDGIATYHRTLSALDGLRFDFGYEFVDADWVLDFTEGEGGPAVQPWMRTNPTMVLPPGKPPEGRPPGGVHGVMLGKPGPEVGRPGETGSAPGEPPSGGGPPLQPGNAGNGPFDGGGSPGPAPLPGEQGVNEGGALTGTGGVPSRGPPTSNSGGSLESLWRADGVPARPGQRAPREGEAPAEPGARPTEAQDPIPAGSGKDVRSGGVPDHPTAAQDPARAGSGSDGGGAVAPSLTLPARTESRLPDSSSGQGPTSTAGTGSQTDRSSTGGPPGPPPAAPGPPVATNQDGKAGPPVERGEPATPAASPMPSLPRYRVRGAQGSEAASQSGGSPDSGAPGTGQSGGAGGSTQQGSATGANSAAAPKGQGPGGGTPDGSAPSEEPVPAVGLPSSPLEKNPRPAKAATPRLMGNRDWFIAVECTAQGAVLHPSGQSVTLAELLRGAGVEPMAESIRQMIARRQATVRPGELPYRPMLRFVVRPDGLETYYRLYPLLGPLGLPMYRQSLEQDEEFRNRGVN